VNEAERRTRSMIGRADLIRAVRSLGLSHLDAVADLLGYERVVPKMSAPPVVLMPTRVAETKPSAPSSTARGEGRVLSSPVWRLETLEPRRMERHAVDGEDLAPPSDPGFGPITAAELGIRPRVSPFAKMPSTRHSPLAPWSRLWPMLQQRLSTASTRDEIDVAALVSRWSRGGILRRLPRRRCRRWPHSLTLLMDRSSRLAPFWADQDYVRSHLESACGKRGLEVFIGGSSAAGRHRRQRMLGRDDALLALTDLGIYGSQKERRVWLAEAKRLERRGRQFSALAPVPAGRMARGLAPWSPIPWERRSTAMGTLGAGDLEARARRLLVLLSPAVRIEPALLRAVRLLLPSGEADVGTEADVWSHRSVSSVNAAAFALQASRAAEWRHDFTAERAHLREKVVRLLRAFHSTVPAEIWHEEAIGLSAMQDDLRDETLEGDLEAAREFLHRVRLTLDPEKAAPTWQAVAAWFERFESRVPRDVWRDPVVGHDLLVSWGLVHTQSAFSKAPPGYDPALMPEASWHPRDVAILQMASSLIFASKPVKDRWPEASPVGVMPAARPELTAEVADDESGPTSVRFDSSPSVFFPRRQIALTTDLARARLEVFQKPDWAKQTGLDGFGLWLDVELQGIQWRLRWVPPGRLLMGSTESEEGRWEDEGPQHEVPVLEGYWLAALPCSQALWHAVMPRTRSEFRSQDAPITGISWDDCQEFLGRLNQRIPGLDAGLPTEVQWEYACGAGSASTPVDGSRLTRRSVVEPNPWGLLQIGDIWEWCADWYRRYGPGERDGGGRVVRGVSHRPAARGRLHPAARNRTVGLRLAAGGVPERRSAGAPGRSGELDDDRGFWSD
jgi:hypothetical protein